jgi:hypothetical protein
MKGACFIILPHLVRHVAGCGGLSITWVRMWCIETQIEAYLGLTVILESCHPNLKRYLDHIMMQPRPVFAVGHQVPSGWWILHNLRNCTPGPLATYSKRRPALKEGLKSNGCDKHLRYLSTLPTQGKVSSIVESRLNPKSGLSPKRPTRSREEGQKSCLEVSLGGKRDRIYDYCLHWKAKHRLERKLRL